MAGQAIVDQPKDSAKARSDWDKEVQKVYDFNMAMVLKINDSIDPMDADKTRQFQHYMNNYLYGDKVLKVDGLWGPNTQKAFKEWESMARYAGSHFTPSDFTIGPRLYDINTSNRSDEEKKIAIDSLYRARASMPLYEK